MVAPGVVRIEVNRHSVGRCRIGEPALPLQDVAQSVVVCSIVSIKMDGVTKRVRRFRELFLLLCLGELALFP